MKNFAYYREQLLYAAPMVKEMCLAEAVQSGQFDAEQMDHLVEIASPDAP